MVSSFARETKATTSKSRKVRRSIKAEPGTDLWALKQVFGDIRSCIAPYYGIDERTPTRPGAKVTRVHTKRDIINGINDRRPCKPPSDALFMAVLSGRIWGLLGEGNGSRKAKESFFDLDVDCKKTPNPRQAGAFLDLVEENLPVLKGLFRSGGSSGNGCHGSGTIKKSVGVRTAEEVNDLLRQLQQYLDRLLSGCHQRGLFPDVTRCEVNGTCTTMDWKEDPETRVAEVVRVRCGTFGRIPVCEASDRPAEWIARPRVPAGKLFYRLHCLREKALDLPTATKAITKPEAAKLITTRPEAAGFVTPQPDVLNIDVRLCRSVYGHPLTEEQVTTHLKAMEEFARRIAPNGVPCMSRDLSVTSDDLAKELLLMTHIMADNTDRAMPTARFRVLHDALHRAKEFEKAYNPKRHAACRNFLSGLGLIEFPTDGNHFWTGERSKGGHFLPGKCMRYGLTQQVVEQIRVVIEEQARAAQDQGVENPPPPLGGNLREGGPAAPRPCTQDRPLLLSGYHFLPPLPPHLERLLGPEYSRTAYREPVCRGRISDYLGYSRSAAA